MIRLFVVACVLAGCVTDYDIIRERAQTYVAAHPDLPSNTAEAIKSNSIHDGMTMRQVVAAWGGPAVVQKFRDGAVQYWFFGCHWPHFCDNADRRFPEPSDIYRSRALFENGVVVDWQS